MKIQVAGRELIPGLTRKGLVSCEVIIKLKCDISLVGLKSLPVRSVAQQ